MDVIAHLHWLDHAVAGQLAADTRADGPWSTEFASGSARAREQWRAQADELIRLVAAGGPELLDRRVDLAGIPSTACVAPLQRAFETCCRYLKTRPNRPVVASPDAVARLTKLDVPL